MSLKQPTLEPSDPYWTYNLHEGEILTAEFAFGVGELGFGITGGFWGAGAGVEGPAGERVSERAEVWFEKV